MSSARTPRKYLSPEFGLGSDQHPRDGNDGDAVAAAGGVQFISMCPCDQTVRTGFWIGNKKSRVSECFGVGPG